MYSLKKKKKKKEEGKRIKKEKEIHKTVSPHSDGNHYIKINIRTS